MAMTIKTLGAGKLRTSTSTQAFLPGELILYAAPIPGEFTATIAKAALVTAMRFFNPSANTVNMHLRFVRYDMKKEFRRRLPFTHILPIGTRLNPGQLIVETTPLVLEAGDGLLAYAFTYDNVIQYVISGVERDI